MWMQVSRLIFTVFLRAALFIAYLHLFQWVPKGVISLHPSVDGSPSDV